MRGQRGRISQQKDTNNKKEPQMPEEIKKEKRKK